jgi:hypothetical protein
MSSLVMMRAAGRRRLRRIVRIAAWCREWIIEACPSPDGYPSTAKS